jgi:hypothetical protein
MTFIQWRESVPARQSGRKFNPFGMAEEVDSSSVEL